MAFGPNPNPQYVVLAVIDQGGYGAQAAAPFVRNIFDYILANPETIHGQDADPGQPGQPDGAGDQPPGWGRRRPPRRPPRVGLAVPSTTTSTTTGGG